MSEDRRCSKCNTRLVHVVTVSPVSTLNIDGKATLVSGLTCWNCGMWVDVFEKGRGQASVEDTEEVEEIVPEPRKMYNRHPNQSAHRTEASKKLQAKISEYKESILQYRKECKCWGWITEKLIEAGFNLSSTTLRKHCKALGIEV